jgi:hypothetical protein
MARPNFFAELKRRNVSKVAIAYAINDPRFQELIVTEPLESTPVNP